MSRGQQRRMRAKSSQQRVARKAQRRRARRAGTSGVAAATAVALGLTGVTPAPASAASTDDTAALVADLNAVGASAPEELTEFAGAVYFRADDGVHGEELWKSDGTAAGTVLVKDVLAGAGDGYPSYLSAAGGNLFFQASDGTGSALWRTDGTAAGTVKVADVDRGDADAAAIGNTLLFSAYDDAHGWELWKSDGTSAGTVLVEDVNPGTYDYYGDSVPLGSDPGRFTSMAGKVYFTADDGEHGEELWSTDGTAAGTLIVADIAPDEYYHGPRELTAIGSTLFFQADDGVRGRELWKSDGTAVGTVLVKDTFPGDYNEGRPESLTDVNGVLYFTAVNDDSSQVWKSNGSTAGTVLVRSGFGTHPSYRPDDFTFAAGKVFFSANGGGGAGTELWRTDGSVSGTALVADLHPGSYEYDYYYSYPNSTFPGELTAVGGKLVFSGSSTTGRELWSSDGTAGGTRVIDINAGPGDSDPTGLSLTGSGTLLMSAADATRGDEIWKFVPGKAAAPSNVFTLPRKGTADTRKGTLSIDVPLPGPGTLRLGPSGKAPVKVVSRTVAKGTTSLTIKPTRAGKRQLRRKLAQAVKNGKKVGKLKVVVAVTYTPTGGTARTVTRQYTLKLR